MIIFFKIRKPGPTDLTWKEKNPSDYRYHSVDSNKPEANIEEKHKPKQEHQKAE